jgi:hypothetical protein
MTDLPAYSGPGAECPKCKAGHLVTAWHYGVAVTEKTPRGDDWPCEWPSWQNDWNLEHLCRYCRNCAYTRAEALTPGSGDAGAGHQAGRRPSVAVYCLASGVIATTAATALSYTAPGLAAFEVWIFVLVTMCAMAGLGYSSALVRGAWAARQRSHRRRPRDPCPPPDPA